MKSLYRMLALLSGAVLAGCHAESERITTEPALHSPAAPRATIPTATSSEAAPPYTGYHRYRGTVGGRPVTVVLTIDSAEAQPGKKLACTGSYYYGQATGGLLDLEAIGTYQPRRPLQLRESIGGRETGTWQAAQPAGPLLSGTWSSPAGKQLPFELREDYTDGRGHLMAVRYEIIWESVKGDPCQPERYEGETETDYHQRLQNLPASSLERQYLRLLGTGAKRPALRQLQCPSAPERRADMKDELEQAGDCVAVTETVGVTYNDCGLLATYESHEEFYQGTPHPSHSIEHTIYDLRTGGTLVLTDLVKPGTDHALRRLITPKLRQEMDLKVTEVLYPAEDDSTTTELPRTNVSLVAEGLEFQYTDYELGAYAYGMPSVTLTWAELLPLLRPTSPVARMLRERGLWRGK